MQASTMQMLTTRCNSSGRQYSITHTEFIFPSIDSSRLDGRRNRRQWCRFTVTYLRASLPQRENSLVESSSSTRLESVIPYPKYRTNSELNYTISPQIAVDPVYCPSVHVSAIAGQHQLLDLSSLESDINYDRSRWLRHAKSKTTQTYGEKLGSNDNIEQSG